MHASLGSPPPVESWLPRNHPDLHARLQTIWYLSAMGRTARQMCQKSRKWAELPRSQRSLVWVRDFKVMGASRWWVQVRLYSWVRTCCERGSAHLAFPFLPTFHGVSFLAMQEIHDSLHALLFRSWNKSFLGAKLENPFVFALFDQGQSLCCPFEEICLKIKNCLDLFDHMQCQKVHLWIVLFTVYVCVCVCLYVM